MLLELFKAFIVVSAFWLHPHIGLSSGVIVPVFIEFTESTIQEKGNMRRYIYKQMYYGKTISSFDALRPLLSRALYVELQAQLLKFVVWKLSKSTMQIFSYVEVCLCENMVRHVCIVFTSNQPMAMSSVGNCSRYAWTAESNIRANAS